MSKKYFIFGFNQAGRAWENHAWKVHQEGVNREGAEETPTEAQVVYNPQGERIARVRHQDAAVGLDSQDVHMSGDPCVVVAENPDGKGNVYQQVERYSQSGKFIGSYVVKWSKTDKDTLTSEKPRRIFY